MTRIFQALEQAARDRAGRKRGEAAAPAPPRGALGGIEGGARDKLTGLYRSITSTLSDTATPVIEFLAPHEEAGTTRIARGFCKVAALELGRSVLLLTADPHGKADSPLDALPDLTWSEAMAQGAPLEAAIRPVHEGSQLWLAGLARYGQALTPIVDSPVIRDYLQQARERFDLVVVDAPPASRNSDGLAIGPMVDGIVVVTQAEKTRWPVARKLVEDIVARGGNVLGIFLNRQRHYIPEWIYRRL